jgi:hypothetical protein
MERRWATHAATPQELAMDLAMQQFFTEQMQLIQNLTATVQNLQA